jgi:hypothetical protein
MDPALEAMDEETVEVELRSVKEMQKKSLETFKKLVRYTLLYSFLPR